MADPRLRDYFINPFQTFGLGTNPFSMGATKEEERLRDLRDKYKPRSNDTKEQAMQRSGLYNTYNTELLTVQRETQKAAFQGAQKGAPQSYTGKLGEPFSTSKYKSTAMFPSKSMPVSDPARLQANPVGYDKEEWWRQSPYVSPRQPGYSIFSMKPYEW
jgi:hypothetical protein